MNGLIRKGGGRSLTKEKVKKGQVELSQVDRGIESGKKEDEKTLSDGGKRRKGQESGWAINEGASFHGTIGPNEIKKGPFFHLGEWSLVVCLSLSLSLPVCMRSISFRCLLLPKDQLCSPLSMSRCYRQDKTSTLHIRCMAAWLHGCMLPP